MSLDKVKKILNNLSNNEIWLIYANSILELKERNLIRTRNIVGERGEFLAIEKYKNTAGLPNLQAAPEGTQNVDALSRKGERYSIKTVTYPNKTTSVFYGIPNGEEDINPKFEFVIIVLINKQFDLLEMYEINWQQFLKYKKWHRTMSGWNLTITKKLKDEAKIISL